MFRTDFGD